MPFSAPSADRELYWNHPRVEFLREMHHHCRCNPAALTHASSFADVSRTALDSESPGPWDRKLMLMEVRREADSPSMTQRRTDDDKRQQERKELGGEVCRRTGIKKKKKQKQEAGQK